MRTGSTDVTEHQHVSSVAAWREARLRLAGFDRASAARLVSEEADLHALLDLIDRGCPPDLAARILAPVDSGRDLR
jgi:hypothetical protein